MKMPTTIHYRGRLYKLRQAASPADVAHEKLAQVNAALEKAEQSSFPIKLPSSMQKLWTVNSGDLLKSVDTLDGSPMLIMWNPITNELLMGSDLDTRAPYHSLLHSKHKKSLETYPHGNYADWIRGLYDSMTNKVTIYKWEPLDRFKMHFDDEQKALAEKLQKKGVEVLGSLLSSRLEETSDFIDR